MPEPTYPTPAERSEILALRRSVFPDVHAILRNGEKNAATDQMTERMIEILGPRGAEIVITAIGRQLEALGCFYGNGLDREVYKRYLRAWRQFGGKRKFLKRVEFEDASKEALTLSMRSSELSAPEKVRLRILNELLLNDVDLWADITPDDPPKVIPPQAAEA